MRFESDLRMEKEEVKGKHKLPLAPETEPFRQFLAPEIFLTHFNLFWDQKLKINVSFWAQKLNHFVSFWLHKIS